MDVGECSHTSGLTIDHLTMKKPKKYPSRQNGHVLQDVTCQVVSWVSCGTCRLLYQPWFSLGVFYGCGDLKWYQYPRAWVCVQWVIQKSSGRKMSPKLKLRFRKGRLRKMNMGWRDGSVVKSTDWSSRGPEFNSLQPHGGSQPSAMGSDALFWCV